MNRIVSLHRQLTTEQRIYLSAAVMLIAAAALFYFAGPEHMLWAAALASGNPGIVDAYRERSPNGGLLPLVKALEQRYPFVKDSTWIECNDGTSHKSLSETALPIPTYRGYNEGVAPSHDNGQVVADATAMAATMSKIDVDLVKLNGPEFRQRRVAAQMRGQLFDLESKCFYSSTKTSPRQFHGLFPRLDLTTGTPAGNQVKKIDAAPAGSDQMSIALIGWGRDTVHMCYPQGSAAGVEHDDLGVQLTKDAGGTNEFRAYVDWVQVTAGFAVENYRYVARACNIDSSAIAKNGTNAIEALIELLYAVEYQDDSVRWTYYAPRTLAKFLHYQARSGVTGGTLTIEQIEGKPVVMANGFPIRVSDGLTIAESIVS